MIRRIVGLAHVADIDTIPDAAAKEKAQRTALAIGKALIKRHRDVRSIGQLIEIAERFGQGG
jgi:5-methylthioribose kinase